jgi:hypothetical protein
VIAERMPLRAVDPQERGARLAFEGAERDGQRAEVVLAAVEGLRLE